MAKEPVSRKDKKTKTGFAVNKKITIIFAVLCALTVCFIWANSVLPEETSSKESELIMEIVTPVIEACVGKGNVTLHLVRKLAHFSEYTFLGIETLVLFSCLPVSVRLAGAASGKETRERQSLRAEEKTGTRSIAFRVFKCWAFALGAALFVSFIDETIQIFSGRGSAVSDMWIDIAGGAAGGLAAAVVMFFIFRARGSRRSGESAQFPSD